MVAEGETYAETRSVPAERVPASALFQSSFRRDTFALWGAFFSCLFAVYLGFSWVPSMLTGAGLSPDIASKGITGFNLGGVAGAILGGLAIMRFGSRLSMLVMTAGAIASAAAMSTMHIAATADTFAILGMLTLTGGLINAVQTTMYALAAHVYPTSFRATGVGTAVAVGRIGAVLSGYAGAWALEYRGSVSFFIVVATAMAVCFVSLAVVRRHVEPA
jgi:AAHS family 4-hydroxybenzoate transporter-like MFS transporter